MVVKRAYQRFIVKLPVTITAGDRTVKGTTVRVSRKGFFVRAQQSFVAGTVVEATIEFTQTVSFRLKGIVRHVRNLGLIKRDNGMGIEFIEKNQGYEEFMKNVEK